MIDLVIVGGGAAGIAAGLLAQRRGIEFLILEASDRLGGRSRTVDWRGHKLDLGCGYLHSAERNLWRVEAEERGFVIDRDRTPWFKQYRNLGFTLEEQQAASGAFEAFERRLRTNPPPSDRASDGLLPDCEWNNWLEAISGYLNGVSLDRVSVADFLAYLDSASSSNWRLPEGYGSLIETSGEGLPHRCSMPVVAISRTRSGVLVETVDGAIEAKRTIVTVPACQISGIRFDPPIEALAAADDLVMGLADKLFLSLERADEFPHDAHLIGNPHKAETGSYMIRPMGMPVIECFFGGRGAEAVEACSLEEAAAVASDELSALLGSEFRKRVAPIVMSQWRHEPWIGGSYTYALPRKADARTRLKDAGDDRIAFAGEALSKDDYSTAHGAFDSAKGAIDRLYGRVEITG